MSSGSLDDINERVRRDARREHDGGHQLEPLSMPAPPALKPFSNLSTWMLLFGGEMEADLVPTVSDFFVSSMISFSIAAFSSRSF